MTVTIRRKTIRGNVGVNDCDVGINVGVNDCDVGVSVGVVGVVGVVGRVESRAGRRARFGGDVDGGMTVDHFTGVSKMVTLGRGTVREIAVEDGVTNGEAEQG